MNLIQSGKITVIMGDSGSGKTTLLKSIAQNNSNSYTIFQGGKQLFPWFTLQKNLDLICKIDYVTQLQKWNIDHLLHRKPPQVSGGEEQRYVLTSAICSGANILLCDEPLSALDTRTSNNICSDFSRVVKENKLSVIWVTHNALEASLLADELYMITNHQLQKYTGNLDVVDIIAQL